MIVMVMAFICQTCAVAQKIAADKVPAAAVAAFKAKFPQATAGKSKRNMFMRSISRMAS